MALKSCNPLRRKSHLRGILIKTIRTSGPEWVKASEKPPEPYHYVLISLNGVQEVAKNGRDRKRRVDLGNAYRVCIPGYVHLLATASSGAEGGRRMLKVVILDKRCDIEIQGEARVITAEAIMVMQAIYRSFYNENPEVADEFQRVVRQMIGEYPETVFALKRKIGG